MGPKRKEEEKNLCLHLKCASNNDIPLLNRYHSDIGPSGCVAGKGGVIGWILYKKQVLLAALGCIICFLLGMLGRNSVPLPPTLKSELHSRMTLETTKIVTRNVSQNIRYNYDLIIAVLVSSTEGEEVERVRKTYSRYFYQPGISNHVHKDWSHRVVLVVPDDNAPYNGYLRIFAKLDVGIFRVRATNGLTRRAKMTRALMAISEQIGFSFLIVAKSDTFLCLNRVISFIQNLPDNIDQPRLYAGRLTKCGPIQAEGHPLYDPEFLDATLGQLPCHPVYHPV